MASKNWSQENFKSPLHVLARKLFLSRNQLRDKYRSLKAENKRLKVQVRDVKQSKEQFKNTAHQAQAQIAQMQEEIQQLRAAQAACQEQKKTTSQAN